MLIIELSLLVFEVLFMKLSSVLFKSSSILNELKLEGWKIVVTTWLAKGSTKVYDDKVRKAKLEWLKKHEFPYDEVHMVKYGTTKANCTRKLGGKKIN